MANEQVLTWSYVNSKNPPASAPISMNIFNQLGSPSTGKYSKGSVTASHTAPTAVPLGEVAGICGYFMFFNPSPTETVNILTGASGAVYAELRPGSSSGVIPVPAGATPYVEATGAIDVDI